MLRVVFDASRRGVRESLVHDMTAGVDASRRGVRESLVHVLSSQTKIQLRRVAL